MTPAATEHRSNAVVEPALSIRVSDLHVSYRVYADTQMTLRQLFAQRFSGRRGVSINAVRGVSFDVHSSEVVGVIGSNGSGKSTLLSAIAGLIPPTSGQVLVSHQPALLGVNAALKPELSGRRNIVIGGLALGISMAEIRNELESVIEFTDLGEAIDRPLRTYSSGMRARLAFSIATLRTPEILLIDEALAVGDRTFREKSLTRIREMRREAGTIVMVTHNLNEVRETCTRAIWLHQGQLMVDGPVDDVIEAYESQS